MAKTLATPKRAPRMLLASLVPNPKNPRVHPISQLEAIARSVKRFGQPRPILVRTENKMIIGGHGLAEAMKLAGEVEADVFLWDVDQKTADAYTIADNRLGELSHTDDDMLRTLLQDIDAVDYGAIGFGADEVEKLLAHDEDEAELVIKQIDASAVADRYWITIHGPLPEQALALKRLQEVMVDLTETTVELGSTPG